MILVTGGAFQGKQRFAEELVCRKKENGNLPQTAEAKVSAVNGDHGEWQQFQQAEVIAGIHLWIRKLLEAGKDPYAMVQELLTVNSHVVITMDQVGCGVVPVKACDRQYREAVGRIGCMMAERAEQVYLLNCGIAKRIK